MEDNQFWALFMKLAAAIIIVIILVSSGCSIHSSDNKIKYLNECNQKYTPESCATAFYVNRM